LDLTVKNRVLVFCSGLLAASLAASAQTSVPTKVGTINIQQAIVNTAEGQKAIKELEEKSAPKKKELDKLQSEIASLREQLSKMSSVGSEEQKRKLMGEIDQKTKSFNRQMEDAQAELDQDQNRLLNELGGRMLAVLDKYATANGFAVILDISSQQTPVLYAANGIDVTREVVDLYNKNVAAGTVAPAKPAGGAPAMGAPATSAPAAAKPPAATTPAPTKPAPVKPAPAK
jgi:outer membrane protein